MAGETFRLNAKLIAQPADGFDGSEGQGTERARAKRRTVGSGGCWNLGSKGKHGQEEEAQNSPSTREDRHAYRIWFPRALFGFNICHKASRVSGGGERGQVSLLLRYGVSRCGAVECGRHELNRGRARFGWANLAQLLDEPASPAIDVVFTHCGPHPLHTHAALFGTHLQRLADAVGQLLGVIRVYLERIA